MLETIEVPQPAAATRPFFAILLRVIARWTSPQPAPVSLRAKQDIAWSAFVAEVKGEFQFAEPVHLGRCDITEFGQLMREQPELARGRFFMFPVA